jgi:hypothetical protein
MMPKVAEKLIIPHAETTTQHKPYGQENREIQSQQTRTQKSRRQKRREEKVTVAGYCLS